MAQVPRIVFSPLGKRWYVLTRYREKRGVNATTGAPTAYLVASVKYDVTDQMQAILATRRPTRRRRTQREAYSLDAAIGGHSPE